MNMKQHPNVPLMLALTSVVVRELSWG